MADCINFRLYLLYVIAIVMASSCADKKGKSSASIDVTDEQQVKGDSSNCVKGFFDIVELDVTPSPAQAQSVLIEATDDVVGYDVSPAGPVTAVLLKSKNGDCSIRFWQIGQSTFTDNCPLPAHFAATEIKWHPKASALFVLGVKGTEYQILRIEKTKDGWNTTSIYSAAGKIKNLITCSRPFSWYANTGEYYNYRIFFGQSYAPEAFRIVSITEHGGRFYQVVGPEKYFTQFKDELVPPSEIKADWALPIAFHPAGHQLVWQNKSGRLMTAYYDKNWGKQSTEMRNIPSTGIINPIPNGLGFLNWQQGKPGIGIYLLALHKQETQLSDYNFISPPCSVADGKGVVGLTKLKEQTTLSYAPINVPMADVVNAWMFAENAEQLDLFQKNDGLFRPSEMNQLFRLYDTENYLCGGYDRTTPTRPYLVTTDVFWELYGAAYEGLFVVKERYEAMLAFWNFVDAANGFYKKAGNQSKWAPVFSILADIKAGNSQNAEMRNIEAAAGPAMSVILKHEYNFGELKPRGHYASSTEMQKYFKAFKYFTTAYSGDEKAMKELNELPDDIKKPGEQWIESYMGFIAPSRSSMAWSGIKNNRPAYNQYPGRHTTIFPLSWGFDNEVLFTDVYHENVPVDKQITGPHGPRMLPSGFDLAAVLGSNLADQLLQSDYEQFPPLRKAIDGLRQNFKTNFDASKSSNLYDKWLNALAMQWIDTLGAPNGKSNEGIWKAKRLQTGLASWATLRHATSLVNERGAAECGEGGFEEILLRAPRGYVEPDPEAFAAIADLLESSVKYVSKGTSQTNDIDGQSEAKQSLYDGIVKRLQEAAKDARLFQSIAEKEKKGEPVSSGEYEKILYLGRVAEHDFLIFKSLSSKDYGLADPEPMAKIADVFGGDISPYLMSAVGNTMEWDNVVPYFGRHEIVKGAVYSYYEFKSEQLLDDKQWREKLKSQPFQPWVKNYLTQQDLSYPAITLY